MLRQNEKVFFEDTGIDPNDHPAILGIILAVPAQVADNLTLDRTVRIAAWAASHMQPKLVENFIEYKGGEFSLGALDPKDMPDVPDQS